MANQNEAAVVVALGSILGNIGQALRNQNLTAQADTLAQHRDQLIAAVRQWHEAYQRERIRTVQLSQQAQTLDAELQRSLAEADQLREENVKLRAAVVDLEVAK